MWNFDHTKISIMKFTSGKVGNRVQGVRTQKVISNWNKNIIYASKKHHVTKWTLMNFESGCSVQRHVKISKCIIISNWNVFMVDRSIRSIFKKASIFSNKQVSGIVCKKKYPLSVQFKPNKPIVVCELLRFPEVQGETRMNVYFGVKNLALDRLPPPDHGLGALKIFWRFLPATLNLDAKNSKQFLHSFNSSSLARKNNLEFR